jgi:hypothetical protein
MALASSRRNDPRHYPTSPLFATEPIGRPEEGDWFFFRSINTAVASPEEMYLAPQWEQAFGTAKTPLLTLEEQS